MNTILRFALAAACAAITLSSLSCAKESVRDTGPDAGDLNLTDVDIESKYLAEGFITDGLFRVVIVTTKEGALDLDALRTRASNRARVSLERSLAAENITVDRTVKTAVLNLIERSGRLEKKDIEHRRYTVFYFDITRSNMVGYFRNAASRH